MNNADIVLEMKDICKSFGGVPVLKGMDFSLKRGEVHALLGGNGAGKSTLMKILNGVYKKDSGQILIDGKEVRITNNDVAQQEGVSMIYQEFSLLPNLTVAQNIFLRRESRKGVLLDDKSDVKRAQKILDKLGIDDIDASNQVSNLSVGYQQMVEIAKALSREAKILIMDEPTASLSQNETQSLFSFIRELKSKGLSIIYISHRMEEVFQICDRVTVLRDGNNVMTAEVGSVSINDIISSMLNVENATGYERVEREVDLSQKPVLRVEDFTYPNKVEDISFELYPGEILGLAGLMGSGRTEILETIFGIRKNSKGSGKVYVNDQRITDINSALNNGIALVPENRREEGLVFSHSIKANFMLPNLKRLRNGMIINDNKGEAETNEYIESLSIKSENSKQLVSLLSGGNQQKVVFGKWLAKRPKVLLLDEPTIGVDIGAKKELLNIICKMADEGVSVIIVSSELIELLSVCNRILVLYNSKIIAEYKGSEIKSEEVLHNAIQGIV